MIFFFFLKDDGDVGDDNDDDDKYIPPEKGLRSPSSATEAASTGRSNAEEFSFGRMKIKDDFVSLLCFMKQFWVVLWCQKVQYYRKNSYHINRSLRTFLSELS